jgi:hypothetical protein
MVYPTGKIWIEVACGKSQSVNEETEFGHKGDVEFCREIPQAKTDRQEIVK